MFSWRAKTEFGLFAGISVSNLSDGIFAIHITCEDPKQKVSHFLKYFISLHTMYFIGISCNKSTKAGELIL